MAGNIFRQKMKSRYILGVTSIDGYTHDNSIALVKQNKILFAASEERYSRIKHDGSFPRKTIRAAMNYLNLKAQLINKIAVGYPKRNILTVLYNKYFYDIIPFIIIVLINRNFKLIKDFVTLIHFLINKSIKQDAYKRDFLANRTIIYVDHHLAHAASAYYTSSFDKCITIALDAFGSKLDGNIRSGAVFLCNKGEIKEIMSVPIYASLGMFYMSITYTLGFKPGDGEGKTMGLSAYGNPKKIYKSLKPFSPTFNNGIWLPGKDWLSGIIPSIPSFALLFSTTRFGQFLSSNLFSEKKEDLAAAAQLILEEELIKLVRFLIKKYPGYENICLAGGVFLNVKANKRLMEIPVVKNIFVHPNAGDGGVALGAAFIATPKKSLQQFMNRPLMNCGMGESFTDNQILNSLKKYGNKIKYQKRQDIIDYTANLVKNDSVIGWFQGRAEWGPRALGFRSVLADPRKVKTKERINKVLKNREWFMPFAPSVLEEKAHKYFKNCKSSPFMTIVFDVIKGKDRKIPAAIHVDNTARPNTVNKGNNPIYYKLLQSFYNKTGLPVILNTSFNRHGLPIVNSPEDAIDHLIMGSVDELIIGKFSVQRKKLYKE